VFAPNTGVGGGKMSLKLFKTSAVLLMLLALGCVAEAIMATTERGQIQGPTAIAVLPDGSVWLTVEDAIWHLDGNGKRIALVDAATLGVGGRIGNLVMHPNGQLVAQVRGDPTLYFLDPVTALIQSRLVPQWQPDLSRHSSDAINYAFSEDGRVAIATGGGHAVALFDTQGRFLGRTQPGTYEFTNGLWWSHESLWTTDTNRQQLVELDGTTLAEKSRVQLDKNCGGWQALGMAASSHGMESETTHTPPLATLIRFANGMTQGRASDIFIDGSQKDFPVVGAPEPRDIKWREKELLLVDNATFSIKRYSENRIPMADFGDAQVQAELTASLDRRNSLAAQYHAYLFGAIALFIVGFAFALRAQGLEKAQTLAALKVDLSQLGTPQLSASAHFRASVRLFWPLILAIATLALFLFYPDFLSQLTGTRPQQATVLVMLLALPLFVLAMQLVRRNVLRGQENPDTEAALNYAAVRFLGMDATFWRLCHPGELPHETFMLSGSGPRFKWLVLTNQRLLVFVGNARERVLEHEYPLGEVLRLSFITRGEMTWKQKLQQSLNGGGTAISIDFSGGTSLGGFVFAVSAARRMATRLQTSTQPHAQTVQRESHAPRNSALRQAIASLLIPGLGQWIQGRTGTALWFFVMWLLALSSVAAIVWTLLLTLAAVSLQAIVFNAVVYSVICLLAASDAWAMRERIPH
jgi:hypothetical protein